MKKLWQGGSKGVRSRLLWTPRKINDDERLCHLGAPLYIIGVSSRDSRVLNFNSLWRICWRGSCNTQTQTHTHTHYITLHRLILIYFYRSGRQSLFVLELISPSSPSWSFSFYTEMPSNMWKTRATDEACEGPSRRSRSWECRKLSCGRYPLVI